MIIDFHTHAFPDHIATVALDKLEKSSNSKAYNNGTISALLKSMDRAKIDKSIVACVATAPAQFNSIFNWCENIKSDRIIPLPSLHPDSDTIFEEIQKIKEAGFIGVKLHPEFQSFDLDELRMYSIYQKIMENELLILFHCGYDISFPDSDRGDPERLAHVLEDFPDLKIIASHLGGWRQWDKVLDHLLGKNIFFDTSYSIGYIDKKLLKVILSNHPSEKILFGTDSPWKDQEKEISLIHSLDISLELKKRILEQNALALL